MLTDSPSLGPVFSQQNRRLDPGGSVGHGAILLAQSFCLQFLIPLAGN